MKHPVCIIVFGLPGTGKSYFAEALASKLGALYLSSDILRKELIAERKYSEAEKKGVYQVMLQKATRATHDRKSVVVDATFFTRAIRRPFHDLESKQTPLCWIEITADEDLIRKRVAEKRKYSEADFSVYEKIKGQFEPLEEPHLVLESTNDNLADMLEDTVQYLNAL